MIHQLQVTYVKEHDRILVRMNTRAGEEIRLWLTRGLVKNLYPHLTVVTEEIAALAPEQTQASVDEPMRSVPHDGADGRALLAFKKQESLQKADFSTPFSAQAQTLPLGSEPLLATTVQLSVLESGQLRLGFEEKLVAHTDQTKNRQVEIAMGADLLNGLMHLLDLALGSADWGLAIAPATPFKKPAPPDAFAMAMPPQYLN